MFMLEKNCIVNEKINQITCEVNFLFIYLTSLKMQNVDPLMTVINNSSKQALSPPVGPTFINPNL